MNLKEFVKIAPCSYRQADYWRRQGWLGEECMNPGSGTGKGDLTPTCLRRALIISACHDTGVRARDVAAALDEVTSPLSDVVAGDVINLTLHNGVSVALDVAKIPGWQEATA